MQSSPMDFLRALPGKKSFWRTAALILAAAFYALSLNLVAYQPSLTEQWAAFFIWILAIGLTLASVLDFKQIWQSLSEPWREEPAIIAAVLGLAVLASFVLLRQYPFVALGDQVRDGGLEASRLLTGAFPNIFAYTPYDAAGLVVPTLLIPFYKLFGNSVYTWRFPAALLGCLDVYLLFLLARNYFSKRVAALAAITLIAIPLHLYYSRTEFFVMLSGIQSTLILILIHYCLRLGRYRDYVLLGVSLGFITGCYASVRTVVFFSFIIIAFVLLKQAWQFYGETVSGHQLFTTKFKHTFKALGIPAKKVIFLLLFFLVGFGPRLLSTTPRIFFHTDVVPVFSAQTSGLEQHADVSTLGGKYVKSLLAYISEPVGYHIKDYRPLLAWPLNLLFLAGLIILLTQYRHYWYFLFIFGLPLTNSAITDQINADHRLTPLLPFCALGVALGADLIIKIFHKAYPGNKPVYAMVTAALIACLLWPGVFFFYHRSAAIGYNSTDYLSMDAEYFLQNINAGQVCLTASADNFSYLNLLHVKEQYEYFNPTTAVTLSQIPNLPNNVLDISKTCGNSDPAASFKYCGNPDFWFCPINDSTPLFLRVDKNLVP
ncbi:MAG: glycosyltransferase family 39 protein [Candidatus Doudnabacteria bacterium]|nr:glycosyltransferase family 39 protein [Candidatus Doudnabacteria bacterium]